MSNPVTPPDGPRHHLGRDAGHAVMVWQGAAQGLMPDYPASDAVARLWDARARWEALQ